MGRGRYVNVKEDWYQLRKGAIEGLIDYYSAPNGVDGDAQRKDAGTRLRPAYSDERILTYQAGGIQDLKNEAIAAADDLSRWLRLLA